MTLFDRLFKPKWQHADPQVRRRGLVDIAADDPTLAQIARHDADPALRAAAAARSNDLALLRELSADVGEPSVRDAARERLRVLLVGNAGDGTDAPPLPQRLTLLDDPGLVSDELAERLARQGNEAELRLAALRRLNRQALYGERAVADPSAELRLQALARVDDPALLERIARASRNRDKRVHRQARERLDELRAGQRRHRQALQLCEELEALRWDGDTSPAAARFVRIEQAWRELTGSAPGATGTADAADTADTAHHAAARTDDTRPGLPDAGLCERFERAHRRFRQQRDAYAERRRRRELLCERLQQALDAPPADAADLQALTAAGRTLERLLDDSERDWQALEAEAPEETVSATAAAPPTAGAGLELRRLEERFRRLGDQLRERRQTLNHAHRQQREGSRQRRALIKEAGRLLARPERIVDAERDALKRRWQELTAAEPAAVAGDPQRNRFSALIGRLDERLRRQQRQPDEYPELSALADRLQQALNDGELQRALDLERETRERLQASIGLERRQLDALRERLNGFGPQLQTLRDWQRWGVDQAREQLCSDIEALADSVGDGAGQAAGDAGDAGGSDERADDDIGVTAVADPLAVAQRVREARAAWQRLDRANGAAGRTLWRRFDSACERAYRPAQTHFEQLAQQRERNLREREAVCEEIERYLATTDWDAGPDGGPDGGAAPDWAAVSKFEQAIGQRWRRCGPVNRGDRKAVDRRYQQALTALQDRLKAPLERELARRQTLIHQVRALAEHPDLRIAIDTVKQLQHDWRPRLNGPRRQEQALWREFRAACDAVFARRQAERDARQVEQRQRAAQQSTLCEELEGHASQQGEALLAAKPQVQALQQIWDTLHQDGDRGGGRSRPDRGLQQRFQRARERFDEACRRQRLDAERTTLDALHERAALCQRLEALLPDDGAGAADTAAGDRQTPPAGAVDEAQTDWDRLPALKPAQQKPVQQRFAQVCRALRSDDPHERHALAERLRANLADKLTLCLRLEIATGAPTPAEYAAERMRYQVERLSTAMAAHDPRPPEQRLRRELADIERTWCGLGVLPAAQAEALQQRLCRALAQRDGRGPLNAPAADD